MKKFYSSTLTLLFINFLMLSASNPGSISGKHSENNVRNYKWSPDQAAGQPIGLLQLVSGSGRTSTTSCIYSDNFDGINDTTALQARGYKTYYRGTGPQGTEATWFQGNPLSFSSYNGPDSGYVASNFNSVTGANTIDNWLVLPSLNLKTNDKLSFYSRSPEGSTFPDSLHVWYSATGDSLPEDSTWVLIGEFVVNVSPSGWEYRSFSIPADGPNGRIAIRYAVTDGGPAGLNSDYIGIDQLLVFTPSAEDGNLFAITTPIKNGCLLSDSETVTVEIKNTGTNPISNFNVSYTVDAGSPVVENISATITPGNMLTYSFTALADFSAAGAHTVNAKVIVSADTNLCNDEISAVVMSYSHIDPLVNPYSMGFESNEDFSSWNYEDINNDSVYWQSINVFPHSGLTCIRKAASSLSDDDWLYTGCFDLTGGINYTLDYWYKVFDAATSCNLESYVGTSPSHTQMTQLLIQDPLSTDTIYYHSINTFTVPNSGTYYFGFHAYSAAGTSSIRIDDINLDDGTFIGIKETSVSNRVNIYPNPAVGIFYLNIFSKSPKITVEVFNLSGQKVYSSQYINLNEQRIDMSKQSNGIYTVRITSDAFVENHSIIINR